MQSVKEFMHCYFSEQTELLILQMDRSESWRIRFLSAEYCDAYRNDFEEHMAYRRKNPPIILEINDQGEIVDAIVSKPFFGGHERRIYHLRRSENSWKIEKKGILCFLCEGSGIEGSNVCSYCNGIRWKFYR